jgi:hypothetical protein
MTGALLAKSNHFSDTYCILAFPLSRITVMTGALLAKSNHFSDTYCILAFLLSRITVMTGALLAKSNHFSDTYCILAFLSVISTIEFLLLPSEYFGLPPSLVYFLLLNPPQSSFNSSRV